MLVVVALSVSTVGCTGDEEEMAEGPSDRQRAIAAAIDSFPNVSADVGPAAVVLVSNILDAEPIEELAVSSLELTDSATAAVEFWRVHRARQLNGYWEVEMSTRQTAPLITRLPASLG